MEPKKKVKVSVEPLLAIIKQNKLQVDTKKVRRAFEYAEEAHRGQKRKSGEPYIMHPLSVAMTLADLGLDESTILAGLLHDVPEDTMRTLIDVRKEFGSDVGTLVEGITKLGKLKYRGMERYVENLRKMFIAMAADIRTIFIKFADRIHNLQTLDALPEKKQKRIAEETLNIYAPIANRLGVNILKDILEDLAFQKAYPKEYEQVRVLLETGQKERDKCYMHLHKGVTEALVEQKIEIISFYGRTKQAYSLYRKLKQHKNNPNKIFDLLAMRVIVPTIQDCYAALGVINSNYRPLPGRMKDYIAQPKPNGYQSLHTTVLCDKSIVEFQIRTPEMHQQAEYGIAAHWFYDEDGERIPDKDLNWVKELAKWQAEIKNEKKYLESLKIDVFQNRIFVFTPQGDVIDLPEDSTPVDFAYAIHSEIGDKCSRAKVNSQLVKLDHKLQSGDVAEIIVEKNRKGPNPNWLKFVKTNQAKTRIRANAPKPVWEQVISGVGQKLSKRKK
ncbi:MAG: bifunctional (p)ppGpp synthetase/guanosine-3',5'-bis(diphosphate) 3'-pyrophosphohydrolase [Candidatus Jacksonbacteria bacterium]|nr:bifunctional (p)ppGpp synthetase/guanosine-3',5'-bis(diphosphate) 3'-pyrophosphohydrolase [Candidatus Jacksonbacteria bacterium]MBT6034251.1 bifunctional (p)ppGpp synthetase/guanosine-3',5'-bis(diphosphate) 3'-pyrophosphohydrolase [Candidatus Jacksonbacteria bacterium]MBT6301339.1 bifunctional (p)ppGpp synthetase/guanosine-3',5'-bis(diphosphate) 3'-pyrophosphohydrolase [Candidatus Jacksonbacteria bacterium]MBT6756981.1 bifunctional (p)ppGpp synthetase/guanosine-3',5'-bis(diphosphate) 3'-pyrop